MNYAMKLSALSAGLMLGALAAQAEVDNQIAVAIGEPGSESFTFGTELWAMSQIALLPDHKITFNAKEVAVDSDRLSLLQDREVDAALVYGRVPNAYENDVRAIMALWPQGLSSEEADPVQFLVHKDVAADVVYLVTKALFEHGSYFENAADSLGIGQPSEAMTGLDIPLHAGAYRYYEESGFGLETSVAADYWGGKQPAADGKPAVATTTFRDFDDAALEPGEIEQIAAACRQALEVGALSLVLGDLSNTGCEVYQRRLVEGTADRAGSEAGGRSSQPQAVAAFATSVEAPPDGATEAEGAFASPVGQGGPAIRWEPSAGAAGAKPGDASDLRPARVPNRPTM